MVRTVAVLDIGKTNAKLAIHDLGEGRDLFVRTRPNRVRPGPPYPHFDVDELFGFLLDALAEAARDHAVDAVSVTTHGACVALVDERGELTLPILDYEATEPNEIADAYDRLRPPFAETFSPRLPNGLNIGAQLFWMEQRFPDRFARARHIIPYAQYWVHRLTGTAASEATSLGCHSDLWAPAAGRFSSLVEARGWAARMAPVRSAFDVAGSLRPDLAERVGLADRAVPVHLGIHDSNASLLPHLLGDEGPLSVVSTGTWVVAFASGGDLGRLDPARDMLANVDAFGRPVPSARFMGGREFDALTGGRAADPSADEVARVIREGIMAWPSFAPGTGPFPRHVGGWSHDPDALTPGIRTAAASFYAALMTQTLLDAMAAGGPTHVEGPFAGNALYLSSLAALTDRPVLASPLASGTTAGAALLAVGSSVRPAPAGRLVPPGSLPGGFARYAAAWAARVRA